MAFVVDASVALAACFDDERSAYVDSVISVLASAEPAHAPAIWPLEVLNGLLVAERRKRINKDEIGELLVFLKAFSIEVISPGPLADYSSELHLARELRLSVYDGSYLALAKRRDIPLATVDARLGRAAAAAGVRLFKPSKRA